MYMSWLLSLVFFASALAEYPAAASAPAASPANLPPALQAAAPELADCPVPGWFPTGFGLKDHSVFFYDGYYYLISINVPDETYFAYGRSQDLCTWENLGPVLEGRVAGEWDELAIWAPFVFVENGVYYMFYTGVTRNFTQSIMLATTLDPSAPASWVEMGVVFQPEHQDMIWQAGQWANNRDPMVLKSGDLYYLYYTAEDLGGPIIGLATAAGLGGPWQDWGATLKLPAGSPMAESPTVFIRDGIHYLIYSSFGDGAKVHAGASAGGPWSASRSLQPGWAHEVWEAQDGTPYFSYLTSYTVTISPLIWDTFYYPAMPFIGSLPSHLMLPSLLR
jgi:hypothetical protein